MGSCKVRFGVIGTGTIGKCHCRDIADHDRATLVAISDISERNGQAVADEYNVSFYRDYLELLSRDDIDAVVVSTPSGTHGQIALAAAKAGKHILVEKPMEIDLSKADQMIEACNAAGVKLGVGYPFRFNKANLRAKLAIEAGLLGDLVLGEARTKICRTQQYYDRGGGWRGTWNMDGGGAVMNQTVHMIDLLQWFMGPVKSVFAHAGTVARKIEAEDLAVAVVEFASGAMGTIVGTTAIYPNSFFGVEVHGQNGSFNSETGELKTREPADSSAEPSGLMFSKGAVDDLVDAIVNDREPMISGEEGRKSLEIVLALYESARTGKIVKLPIPSRYQPASLARS
ncbi:MAG: Gfo/Idh/MocA family oxidoreductase [Actinobacteria bacterium]|nr:Gfo/Idh/MocA family oxidoreductase [Actinomycetota bacterium]